MADQDSGALEFMSDEEWQEVGAQSARKGEYRGLLQALIDSGRPYARISTAADSGGRFAGAKPASVVTALKQATKADGVPEEFKNIEVSSKKGVVYLKNTAAAA